MVSTQVAVMQRVPDSQTSAAPVSIAPVSVVASEPAATPFPAASAQPASYASTSTMTEGALAKAPEPAESASAPNVESIRHAIGCALVEAGHVSAAQLLGAGNWTLDTASLRIEVAIAGKRMLALTINAAAEKIIRQQLQQLGAPARFLVVPGEGAAKSSAAFAAAPIAGSVQEAAMSNPLVRRAQEIFKAEVRSVVDLRTK
jgi:DNA polymerase-3 subunit gamma/tau